MSIEFAASRDVMVGILSSMEENVSEFLVIYGTGQIQGGMQDRYDPLESVGLAMDILLYTKADAGKEDKKIREDVALYIARNAYDLEDWSESVSWYCDKNHSPYKSSLTRRLGADYGSNMELFSVLEALETVLPEPSSDTRTPNKGFIEEIFNVIFPPEKQIRDKTEFFDYVEPFVESVHEFIYEGETFKELLGTLREHVEEMRANQNVIFEDSH